MSTVPTKFKVERRNTQQGFLQNRIVVDRYQDRYGEYAPVLSIDQGDLHDLIRALQSFAVQGKVIA